MKRYAGHIFYLAGLLGLVGCEPALPTPAPPATPKVSISRPVAREVREYAEYTGRTDAVSTVEVRARVTGYLIKVLFKDGDIVKQNELLYEIDPRPFQDDLDRAKGEVERDEARKKLLKIQVDRYSGLVAKGVNPQEELDQLLGQQAENIGSLKSAQAQAAHAALNLEFTRVIAPTTVTPPLTAQSEFRIDRTLVTPGNLVTADTTVMTKLVSIDPMYAYFDVDEPTVLRVQKMIREGVIPSKSGRNVEVLMGLADDLQRKFPLRGTLDFVSNTVDPQTGTIVVRGVFSNPYKMPGQPAVLTPGLFVRVRLHMGPPHPTLLVNERAIGTDQGQKFVYVVDQENKVCYRPVKLGQMFDGLQAIEEGLKPGDRVVVNGLQRVRPGIGVQPDEVDMLSLVGPGGEITQRRKDAKGK
jgi:RND family efflux transporter MFP subunit